MARFVDTVYHSTTGDGGFDGRLGIPTAIDLILHTLAGTAGNCLGHALDGVCSVGSMRLTCQDCMNINRSGVRIWQSRNRKVRQFCCVTTTGEVLCNRFCYRKMGPLRPGRRNPKVTHIYCAAQSTERSIASAGMVCGGRSVVGKGASPGGSQAAPDDQFTILGIDPRANAVEESLLQNSL